MTELSCWTCPWLSVSCLCPGFRQLLDLASSGQKSTDLICDRCPVLVPLPPFKLDVVACGMGCNMVTLGKDGFNQVYKLAKG